MTEVTIVDGEASSDEWQRLQTSQPQDDEAVSGFNADGSPILGGPTGHTRRQCTFTTGCALCLFASASSAQGASTKLECEETSSVDQTFYLIGVLSTLIFILFALFKLYQAAKHILAWVRYLLCRRNLKPCTYFSIADPKDEAKKPKRNFKWPDLGSDDIKVHFNMAYCRREGENQLVHAAHIYEDCHALRRMMEARSESFLTAGRVCKICLNRTQGTTLISQRQVKPKSGKSE
jgi:hypothetical protein